MHAARNHTRAASRRRSTSGIQTCITAFEERNANIQHRDPNEQPSTGESTNTQHEQGKFSQRPPCANLASVPHPPLHFPFLRVSRGINTADLSDRTKGVPGLQPVYRLISTQHPPIHTHPSLPCPAFASPLPCPPHPHFASTGFPATSTQAVVLAMARRGCQGYNPYVDRSQHTVISQSIHIHSSPTPASP